MDVPYGESGWHLPDLPVSPVTAQKAYVRLATGQGTAGHCIDRGFAASILHPAKLKLGCLCPTVDAGCLPKLAALRA